MQAILVPEALYAEIRDIAKAHRMTHAQVISLLLELATKAARERVTDVEPVPDDLVH